MPTTIKEALGMDDAMPIVGLRATIKAAFESKSGQKGDTEWCLLPMILVDDAGTEMRATWFSPLTRDHKSLKGRPVEINARKNQKNQLSGAKIEHRMYQDKPQVSITVTGDHLRFLDEGTEDPTSASQVASTAQGKAATYSGTVSQPKGAQGAPTRLTDLDLLAAVARWTKGLREALDPAHPETVPIEVVQPLLSTFLIAATSDRSSMTIVPPGRVPAHVATEKIDTKGENLQDKDEDQGPPSWTDDDIPF